MAPVVNGRVLFNAVPEGYPIPGVTTVHDISQTIDLDTVPLEGGFLVKTLELSIDPYLRNRMRHPPRKYASPPWKIGEPISSFGVGAVVRSENPNVKPGDHVYGVVEHVNYFVAKKLAPDLEIIDNPYKLPWSTFVGVLGMPGQTAYFGWKEYANPQKGDTVYISTGAGPVGSLVIQLAKLDGLKVIASAGSEEKLAFMKEIGADVVFNYKTTSVKEVLEREGPLNIYWDNVGGETLDIALESAELFARFIECGMISGYNSTYSAPVKNLFLIVTKTISMHGFTVTQLAKKHGKAFREFVTPKIASGEFKYTEDVSNGLESVGDALLAVQKGTNTGKAVIHVADE